MTKRKIWTWLLAFNGKTSIVWMRKNHKKSVNFDYHLRKVENCENRCKTSKTHEIWHFSVFFGWFSKIRRRLYPPDLRQIQLSFQKSFHDQEHRMRLTSKRQPACDWGESNLFFNSFDAKFIVSFIFNSFLRWKLERKKKGNDKCVTPTIKTLLDSNQ